MKKIIITTVLLIVAAAVFVGCAATDVVLKYSPGSLHAITTAFPEIVTDNTINDHYYYVTADNETKLLVSDDYSMTGTEDIVLQTPLQPFADAGLEPSELGAGYRTDEQALYLTADYGNGTGEKENITDSIFESVKYDRMTLSYHQDLDHYGIKIPGGKFEFAKDYKTNDKDIVFVIAAKPLADLGVDVQNIDGWVFKTMKDTDGSDIDVLLKPYDLGN